MTLDYPHIPKSPDTITPNKCRSSALGGRGVTAPYLVIGAGVAGRGEEARSLQPKQARWKPCSECLKDGVTVRRPCRACACATTRPTAERGSGLRRRTRTGEPGTSGSPLRRSRSLVEDRHEAVHLLLVEEMEPALSLLPVLESDHGDHVKHLRLALEGAADPLNGQNVILIA